MTNWIHAMIKPCVQLKTKSVHLSTLPEIRRKNIQVLYNDVQYVPENKLCQLEQLIYDQACGRSRKLGIPIDCMDTRFCTLYNSIMRHYRLNLNKDGYIQNTYLEREITAKRLDVTDIVKMNAMELHQDKWQDCGQLDEAELNVIMKGGDGNMEHDTSLYLCGRCKGNNCAYREEQSRSMDEGSTHRIRCKDCGNRWNHFN